MATARSVSPGGALLRTSRMFSIPAPIPGPPVAGKPPKSRTMTAPFPTHQAITTLKSARKQGDWGLKRPLPLKSTTKSAQAMIRVKHIDSVEQVTDFSSATDHGITLQKFQDLRLPMTVPKPANQYRSSRMGLPGKSVFEDDTTSPSEDVGKRWKFTGPWLAGMSMGEFNKWLEKEVKPRRHAFHAFLKEKIAAQLLEPIKAQALELGEDPPAAIDPASITDDQVTDYLRKLRSTGNYQDLYATVGEFLDLPPLNALDFSDITLGQLKQSSDPGPSALNSHRAVELNATKNPYSESGPPIMHPSAGISYLRTAMYIDNHPVYGPQAHHAPVEARVLRPRKSGLANSAKIGVAGFVVDSPFGETVYSRSSIAANALTHFDAKLEGGAKLYVQPQSANIKPSEGTVAISVGDIPDDTTKLVAQELVGQAKIFGEAPAEKKPEVSMADKIRGRTATAYRSAMMSSSENYGLSNRES